MLHPRGIIYSLVTLFFERKEESEERGGKGEGERGAEEGMEERDGDTEYRGEGERRGGDGLGGGGGVGDGDRGKAGGRGEVEEENREGM